MSETTSTTEQTTAQLPQPAPVAEATHAEAPKPAQDAKARPRVPRAHCAC